MHRDRSPRQLLEQLYRGMISALQPELSVQQALGTLASGHPAFDSLHLLAIGKAALAMTRATQRWCDDHGVTIAGGIAVSHTSPSDNTGRIRILTGDHPVPAERSSVASAQLGLYIDERIAPGDRVIVLLSGGASSLIGAPRHGIDATAFRAGIAALLGAGLTIDDMNAVRRRLSRWGGGKLGAALTDRGARVDVLVISDVMGDDLASIGSGPCVPDHTDAAALSDVLQRATISDDVRARLRGMLGIAIAQDAAHATRAIALIPHHIIGSNRVACDKVLRLARDEGAYAIAGAQTLAGDAHACGTIVGRELLSLRQRYANTAEPIVMCWGGEPTVTVHSGAPAGGRMQALALAAAKVLHDAGAAGRIISILAAGTDGRDGPTDAAGAIVDESTWHAITMTGRDPETALMELRSSDALRAVNALLPAFASGTNVNDVVLGFVRASDLG